MKHISPIQKGYTLIEILIVLFIISIITTVALLKIGHNDTNQLKSFVNELTQMMTLAEEQAMLQPTVLGLSLDERSYQFASLKAAQDMTGKNRWEPVNDHLLNKHIIPSDIRVMVQINHQSIPITRTPSEMSENNPQIIISTNGDMTPFIIYVGKKGERPRYAIIGEADGRITNKSLS